MVINYYMKKLPVFGSARGVSRSRMPRKGERDRKTMASKTRGQNGRKGGSAGKGLWVSEVGLRIRRRSIRKNNVAQ